MGFFDNFKSKWTFKCGVRGKTIEQGDFMSIVGKAPKKSYGGSLEPLINKFVKDTGGKIYCRDCFNEEYNNK